jgi:hypothetical protein
MQPANPSLDQRFDRWNPISSVAAEFLQQIIQTTSKSALCGSHPHINAFPQKQRIEPA